MNGSALNQRIDRSLPSQQSTCCCCCCCSLDARKNS